MSDVKYFKSSDPEIVKICVALLAQKKELHKKAVAFADLFGGIPVVLSGLHGNKVYGVKFEPPLDNPLWTQPDKKYFNSQHPRASLRKATPAQRQELKALNDKWENNFPKEQVSLDPLYQAMGTDWGVVFILGLGFFFWDETLYVMTGVPLNDPMTEITVTEYCAAEAEQKAGKS